MNEDAVPMNGRFKQVATTLWSKTRYAASEIGKHWQDPFWWRSRFAAHIAGPFLGIIHDNEGMDYMDAEWDNLLILDACRADLFEEAIDTSQFNEYGRVHSPGCSSPEWMQETFGDSTFSDTVYVTANPWISKVAPDSFHKIVNLWIESGELSEEEIQGAIGGHDAVGVSSGKTIHPDTLADAARRVHKEHPNKRIIVHFFQPHAPVVGHADGTKRDEVRDELYPGDDLKEGNVSREEVWEGYIDNLLYAFHHANELAEDLGGRSVFTADHGELFGEWLWPFPMRAYAHPDGVRHPKLTEVPWAVKEVGERRIIEEGDIGSHEADEDVIDDRLRNLGYKV